MVFRFSCGGLYGFTSAREIFEESRPGDLVVIARDLRPGHTEEATAKAAGG